MTAATAAFQSRPLPVEDPSEETAETAPLAEAVTEEEVQREVARIFRCACRAKAARGLLEQREVDGWTAAGEAIQTDRATEEPPADTAESVEWKRGYLARVLWERAETDRLIAAAKADMVVAAVDQQYRTLASLAKSSIKRFGLNAIQDLPAKLVAEGAKARRRHQKRKEAAKTRRITEADWYAEGRRLFGESILDWSFCCPVCGHDQKVMDFKEFLPKSASDPAVGYADAWKVCIGVLMPNSRAVYGQGPGPCKYAGTENPVTVSSNGQKAHYLNFSRIA
jgi:rubrerythrin